MVPESRRQAGQWLAKAQGDLDSAKILFQADPPQWETGLFHCQQAAEKVLKGWLAFHEIPFLKTHDLAVLLNLCAEKEKGFLSWQASLPRLTPFATDHAIQEMRWSQRQRISGKRRRLPKRWLNSFFRKLGKRRVKKDI